jgi:acetyl esterase/lipase
MTLVGLRQAGLPQPALALALSPWTDIGRRGASQFGHDRYDMVQGYQTLQYGQWLKGNGLWSDDQLSPIAQDLRHLAPIYIQAGGKEILVDMIRDFAAEARKQGANIRLDVWPDMTHEFHAYGSTLPQSEQAIAALRTAIQWTKGGVFEPAEETELNGLDSAYGKAQPEVIKPV